MEQKRWELGPGLITRAREGRKMKERGGSESLKCWLANPSEGMFTKYL